MGSSDMADTTPKMANETIKPLKYIYKLFQFSHLRGAKKKSKEKKNIEPEIKETPQNHEPIVVTDVKWLIENVNRLKIGKDETKDDDEIKNNFTIKTVKVKNTERSASNSSGDSGFSDKISNSGIEKESFSKKSISKENPEKSQKSEQLEVKDGKKKKLQTVFLPRGPVRHNNYGYVTHPYQQTCKQINKHTFSGGQVTVNESLEIDNALSSIDAKVEDFIHITEEERNELFLDAHNLLVEENPLQDFNHDEIIRTNDNTQIFPQELYMSSNFPTIDSSHNLNVPYVFPNDNEIMLSNSLLTPPRSNEGLQMEHTMYSPKYTSYTNAINTPPTDYTSSPERLSPNNFQFDPIERSLDLEEDQMPSCVGAAEFAAFGTNKAKEKLRRSSSISMKIIKEMQRELQNEFSRNVCCKNDRAPVHKIFYEHFSKLSAEQRKVMLLKISKMDLWTASGLLHNILKGLRSESCETESLHYACFYSICQQVLAQRPASYLKEFGLELLIDAALSCYARPELTRLLVYCIRRAYKQDETNVPIFIEVDGRGDNLVGACARAGDSHAAVLAELVLKGAGEVPLFDVSHTNTEGYTPLHIACVVHNSAEIESCLQIVHILLAHGAADISKGDMKVGDTALHLAVNSVNCDMKLVQTLFLHIDRKNWKQHAQAANRSSVSPLEYARSAAKSSVRRNYPTEVLDMLKKCR